MTQTLEELDEWQKRAEKAEYKVERLSEILQGALSRLRTVQAEDGCVFRDFIAAAESAIEVK